MTSLRTCPGMIMGQRIAWQVLPGEDGSIRRIVASVVVAGAYSMVSTPVEVYRQRMGVELWRAHLRSLVRTSESTLRRRVMMKVIHG